MIYIHGVDGVVRQAAFNRTLYMQRVCGLLREADNVRDTLIYARPVPPSQVYKPNASLH